MSVELGNLANGTGKIYRKLPTGEISTFNNTVDDFEKIMWTATGSRLIYTKFTQQHEGSFTDAFRDEDYGNRYYFNDSPDAPDGDITDALDITKYTIAPTKCYKDNLTIADDQVTITRYSFFHVILLTPEEGTFDILNYLNHDLQPGDVLFITLADDSTDQIQIQANTVADGNFKLVDSQDIFLQGAGATAMFIRDGSGGQLEGGKGYLREIGRPSPNMLSIARITVNPLGGTIFVLDTDTPDGMRITTKNGLLILDGDDQTLTGGFVIGGESIVTSRSTGTTIDVIMKVGMETDFVNGNSFNIFGTTVPDYLVRNGAFTIRAWFDDILGQFVSKLIPTHEQPFELVNALSDGSDSPFTAGPNVDPDSFGGLKLNITPSFIKDTNGIVNFYNAIVFTTDLVPGDAYTLLGTANSNQYRTGIARNFNVLATNGTDVYEAIISIVGGPAGEISVQAMWDTIPAGVEIFLDGVTFLANYTT